LFAEYQQGEPLMPTGTLVTYAVELASIADSREATLAANEMSSGPTGIVSGADRLAVAVEIGRSRPTPGE
jgi:hypothetical protein